jgi:CRISPR-associated protein Cas1
MIKRTIEISSEPAHVALRNDQIQLSRGKDIVGTIPCEDLGILVVDHPQTTFSACALARIAELGGVVVLCDRAHLPTATLLRMWDVVLAGGGVDTLVASSLSLLRRFEARLKETEVS